MEKNIAALMRQDTRTVHVSLGENGKELSTEYLVQVGLVSPEHPFRNLAAQPAKAPDTKTYMYVTHLPLAVGDLVVVPAANRLTVGVVRQVDEGVSIEPNSNIKFGWVVCKVDTTDYQANAERNEQIETAMAEAYKATLRRSFAQNVMAGLDDANKAKLTALLDGPKGGA